MAREMTPQERAAAIVQAWMKQSTYTTESFINDVLEHDKETRRAALLEIADYAKRECCVQCADTDRWQKGHNVAALHIASVCEAKIRELGS